MVDTVSSVYIEFAETINNPVDKIIFIHYVSNTKFWFLSVLSKYNE